MENDSCLQRVHSLKQANKQEKRQQFKKKSLGEQ